MAEHYEAGTRMETLPLCACPKQRRVPSLTIFGPSHAAGICPRYIPNLNHFCPECGTAIHYSAHLAWCGMTPKPDTRQPADEATEERQP